MFDRCNNPNCSEYKNYGNRGISICDCWLKFENFLKDMGECPKDLTIERKNNDLGYFKENCCWATYTDQSRNQRLRKDNKTGMPGVFWYNRYQKYQVYIHANKKRINLGYFIDLEKAKQARKKAEQKYWGKDIATL